MRGTGGGGRTLGSSWCDSSAGALDTLSWSQSEYGGCTDLLALLTVTAFPNRYDGTEPHLCFLVAVYGSEEGKTQPRMMVGERQKTKPPARLQNLGRIAKVPMAMSAAATAKVGTQTAAAAGAAVATTDNQS